jgi:PAS domain S-box-containing protein
MALTSTGWGLQQWAERLRLEAKVHHALPRPSRRFFRDRIEKVPVAVLLADDEGGYFDANRVACELTGYSRAELLKLGLADLTPGADDAVRERLWKDFIRARAQSGIFTLRRKDRRLVNAEYSALANVFPGIHLSALVPVGEPMTSIRVPRAARGARKRLPGSRSRR